MLLHKKPEDFHVEGPTRDGLLRALYNQLYKDIRLEQPLICGGDRRVLLCFICDPYQPHENGFTRAVLETLVEHNVPFQVLTKGGVRGARDFDLYADGAGWFGTSLCFTDDATCKEWEPKAAPIGDRLLAIREAQSQGIYTWVSIEPVIDPVQAIEVIGRFRDSVDEIRVGKLNHHPHAENVDWVTFAKAAYWTLQELDCAWRIKDDLYAYLPPGSPQSSGGDPNE